MVGASEIQMNLSVITRARRWMAMGLLLSVLGSRVVDGSSDGLVAVGVLPLVWLAIIRSWQEALTFISPVLARLFRRFDPGRVLVLSDLTEASVAGAFLVAMTCFSGRATPLLVAYFVVTAVFPAVGDVVEELYAHRVAAIDHAQALKFNAGIYSALAFFGLVFAMPAGAALAGLSVNVIVAVNLGFSFIGSGFRWFSSRTSLPAVGDTADPHDTAAVARPRRSRRFVGDLLTSGPGSPIVEFVIRFGSTVAGVFVYLWIAHAMPGSNAGALAIVMVCFGVGATLGPWIAVLVRRRLPLDRAIERTYLAGCVLLAIAITVVTETPNTFAWKFMLGYVVLCGVWSRVAAVLTTTSRQMTVGGTQFARIMGWAFTFGSAGALLGAWAGAALSLPAHPALALGIHLATVVVALVAIRRRHVQTCVGTTQAAAPPAPTGLSANASHVLVDGSEHRVAAAFPHRRRVGLTWRRLIQPRQVAPGILDASERDRPVERRRFGDHR